MTIKVGDSAIEFNLPDENGDYHRLKDYAGKKVILYFYPKDDTPGCTAQACSFRDNIGQFNTKNSVVLGVSPDSIASHKKFKEKYGLPYTLLADENHAISEAYGVWQLKKNYGKEYMGIVRTTFVIDEEGKIMKVYEKVKPEENAREILELLEAKAE